MKRMFLIVILLISFPIIVMASDIPVARIGNTYYDTLEDAINASTGNDVITMVSNLHLIETRDINKDVTINLNGYTISKDNLVFRVQKGSLTLIGKGTIRETDPYYAPILLKGSTNVSDTNYTNLTIDGDILLEGWSGVFIDQNVNKGYGINVSLNNARINSLKDSTGVTGSGVYVNGKIKDNNNYPVINIKNVTINSNGVGIYQAGYAKTIIENSNINGDEASIGIKSGILNIESGNFTAHGPEKIPTSGSSSGINPTGTTIQIESNSDYKGDIVININGGTFKSMNSHVIYEYIGKGTSTRVSNFLITGGTFISDKDNFLLSSSFISKNSPFIKGGTYTSDPSSYVVSGYKTENSNSDYVVSPVFNEKVMEVSNHRYGIITTLILGIVLVSTTLYILNSKRRKHY